MILQMENAYALGAGMVQERRAGKLTPACRLR
jgi:hypothetical protein